MERQRGSSRAAFFLPNLAGGGAEGVMLTLGNALVSLGLDVDLVLVEAKGVFLSQVDPRVRIVNLGARTAYHSFPKLLRYLRASEPDALLSSLDLTNLILLFARRFAGTDARVAIRVANTVSLHERSWPKKKLERVLLRWFYPWADEIVAVSKGVAQDLADYIGVPLERIRTIYNPVVTEEMLSQAREPLDHPWFASGGPPVILGVGRLTKQKDFATLVRAFARVRRSRPARLLILGEGEQRESLEGLVRELSVGGDVSLPGFAENPFAYMSRAAVLAVSSLWEGLPNALIQAMACGCPVVSTDCPSGPDEILAGGKYGYLVPVGDEAAIAEAILKVLAGEGKPVDPEWLHRFNPDRVVAQYLDALRIPQGVIRL